MRKTKIVATLGPASSTPEMVGRLIEAGMDVARFNFSHGSPDEHRRNVTAVREFAERSDRAVACLQDLSGPKIRTGKISQSGGVDLIDGARFVLTTDDVLGDAERVSTTYQQLPMDIKAGDRIVIDDGLISLAVREVEGSNVITEVVSGGTLKSNKGINLPGVQLSTPSITEKDRRDILLGLELDFDFIAMSFVRRKDDIEALRAFLREQGRDDVHVIAKIERPEAVEDLDAILTVADGVMVARGDLGVELSPEGVPTLQKRIIYEANQRGRPVITATQMLESMVTHPVPTRAEASDVANAILDGTDALMLSAETASGKYPVESVETMARIAEHTERHIGDSPAEARKADYHLIDGSLVARAVALAARRAADELNAKYIVAFTESGATVRLVSHSRPRCHILGFTPSNRVYRRLSMRWGVTPMHGEHFETTDTMLEVAMKFLRRKGLVDDGDIVVTVCGHTTLPGATNMMKVLKF
ncbi:MAG TPA: pyruvate kinase [Vicinamibacteria bacterium]|nr:pyruvate kinase [Vicinamibacteria bacterium]